MNDSLAKRATIEELVYVYERAEADVRQGFALIDGAMVSLGEHFEDDGHKSHIKRGRFSRDIDFDRPDDHLRELRRDAWRALIERLKLRKAMSIKAWKELEEKVSKEEPPPLTVEMVTGMVDQFREDLPAMLKASVDEVFNWLRPPGSKYKTNTEMEIGERAILGYTIEASLGHWRVQYHRQQELIALENVFSMIDGKVRRDDGKYYSALTNAIEVCPTVGPCAGKTDYFEFKGYHSGNLHFGTGGAGLLSPPALAPFLEQAGNVGRCAVH